MYSNYEVQAFRDEVGVPKTVESKVSQQFEKHISDRYKKEIETTKTHLPPMIDYRLDLFINSESEMKSCMT